MLQQLAQVIGDSISIILGIVVDHNSIFSAVGMVKDISVIQNMKGADVLAAIKSATPEDRAAADKVFADAVVLKNKDFEAKIEKGELDLERAADIVVRAIHLEKDAAQLVADVKAI